VGPSSDLLGRGEVPAAARLLARAFDRDPVIDWHLAGPNKKKALRAFFRAPLYELVSLGTVYAARGDDGLLGVAAWTPPGGHVFEPDPRVRDAERMLNSLYPSTAPKLLAGFEVLHDLHPAQPHWYLFFVGLEPAQQGRGLGESLLSPVLNRADADRTLCYLETPFSGTHSFYRRLGFEVISELRPFEAPFPVWAMLRRPGQGNVQPRSRRSTSRDPGEEPTL
jgi:ribosomal protein S18 acetylase RimI-like enzyme